MLRRLPDARAFIGAAFDGMGPCLAGAGLAWGMAQQHEGNMIIGVGASAFGMWEDGAGLHLSEYPCLQLELTAALEHLAKSGMQLPDERTVRLARGQQRFGAWPRGSRCLVIRWYPRNPDELHQARLHGSQVPSARDQTGPNYAEA